MNSISKSQLSTIFSLEQQYQISTRFIPYIFATDIIDLSHLKLLILIDRICGIKIVKGLPHQVAKI